MIAGVSVENNIALQSMISYYRLFLFHTYPEGLKGCHSVVLY